MISMPDRWLILLGAALLMLAAPLSGRTDAVQTALSAAAAAAARGDGIEAEVALTKALASGAGRREVAARMGEAQLLQGDLQKARQWLVEEGFSEADAALGWRMTGLLLRLEGRLPEAGQAYDKALAIAPNDPLLWVDIGRLRYIGREHVLALEASERALSAGPENPRAIELRAQLLNEQAGPVAAIPLYERGLRVAPDDLRLLSGYAAALGEAGRAVEMLRVVRRVNVLAPRSPMPLYFQAVLAARAGKIDLAKNLMDRVGNRLKDVPAATLLESALELEAGNSAIAVNALERLDRQQPFNQRVQLLYAKALLAVDDHMRLRQRFGHLADRPDASPYLLTLLGRSYERTGDRETAGMLLDRAATANLEPLPMRERPDFGTNFGSFESFVAAGDAALLQGGHEAAIMAYRQAAGLRYPEWLMLRFAYAVGGVEALSMADRYLAAFPDSLLAPRLAAQAAVQNRDWHRASMLLANANRRQGLSDPRLLADLALAQLQGRDPQAALTSATAAYRQHRSSPDAAHALGLVLSRLGPDPTQAASLLNKAQAIGSTNPTVMEVNEHRD